MLIECTTCGDVATHLYGAFDAVEGVVCSVNGRGRWSPTCDDCDDPELVQPDGESPIYRVTAPLAMWRDLPYAKVPDPIDQRILELRQEIRTLANEGRTFECDVRHGKIATLEEAKAILAREDD